MAITMDPAGIATLNAMRARRAGQFPTIGGIGGNVSGGGQNLPQMLPGSTTLSGSGAGAPAPPMPGGSAGGPPGIVTQNGQQGIMGRGNNFQALGAAAQRRLAQGGTLGQLQPGAARPGAARPPMGAPPGAAAPQITQTKPFGVAVPGGMTDWGSSSGYRLPPPPVGPGSSPNYSDFVGMVGNGTLGGSAVPRLGPGATSAAAATAAAGVPGAAGAAGAAPNAAGAPGAATMVDPAQGPGAGGPPGSGGPPGAGGIAATPNLAGGSAPSPDIIGPLGVAQRDAQPPMAVPGGLQGGFQSGRGGFLPDARAGYANLMSRFAY